MNDFRLTTPVAFFIFNRAETTARVFEAIRQARPPRLLVVADGPRPAQPDDPAKCAATRAIVDRIDWDCEVSRNFSDVNLGCKRRISSGLDWIFSEVEEAIILEDDCLPAPSFFHFCQDLLERHRDDERIMIISGNNFQSGRKRTDHSYYFSKYSHIWGWASWRRAWRLYDVEMKSWPEYKKSGRIRSVCEGRDEQRYWTRRFDHAFSGGVDTWDYQLLYACWYHNRLTALPESNLVSNIGFGGDATHVALQDDDASNLPVTDIWEIRRPALVERHREADRYTFDLIYKGRMRRVIKHLKRGFSERGVIGLAYSALNILRMTLKLLREH